MFKNILLSVNMTYLKKDFFKIVNEPWPCKFTNCDYFYVLFSLLTLYFSKIQLQSLRSILKYNFSFRRDSIKLRVWFYVNMCKKNCTMF